MKTATCILALAVCATGAAVAQDGGSRGSTSVRRPNSSNFGWQDRQRAAAESSESYIAELKTMPEEAWKDAALAIMAFESSERSFSFDEVVRIGAATGDRKATSRPVGEEDAESPAWIVEFGRKKPKVLTLTLTDRARTEVQCAAETLFEARAGYVAIFQTEFEIFCLARPSGSS